MLSAKLKEAAGNSADATLYVDDVFSTWLYTGNGSTQTITNGIDLAGKGGMTWIKSRSNTVQHVLEDTNRGAGHLLSSNNTAADTYTADTQKTITSFDANGFSLGTDSGNWGTNFNAYTYASWTFRKAAKFFDVVTYTGNGVVASTTGAATNYNRVIPHSLGIAPGMYIVKRTDSTGNWLVANVGASGVQMDLNLTNASTGATGQLFATSTGFQPGTNRDLAAGGSNFNYWNENGATYVAYLFAHDTSSTGIIQCGSYTGSASTVSINLGWEPQYVLIKPSTTASGWVIVDSMRGTPVGGQNARLYANASYSEGTGSNGPVSPTATGFTVPSTDIGWNNNGQTYIYMAIRRPNKPPTSGTQVFALGANGLGTAGGDLGNLSASDLAINSQRAISGSVASSPNFVFMDRLRGIGQAATGNTTAALYSSSSAAQVGVPSSNSTGTAAGTNGAYLYSPAGLNSAIRNMGQGDGGNVGYAFKRAPGFFDVVCYKGNGSTQNVNHNLTVIPELMIVKDRTSAGTPWCVYSAPTGNSSLLQLETTGAVQTGAPQWNSTTPTSSVFSLGGSYSANNNGDAYVAYLFATLAGISKVGSYTGNGTGQAIACGFSAGARFVLIKRTDSTGDWYTFDSARGLTSGSSPYLLLNSTAAEVTGNNGVYASTGGFTLGSTASTTTNINAATYIFLAVA